MKVGYFDSKEFACNDGSVSPYGEMNVVMELVELLNHIRELYGKPIVVTSGYRSPAHNKKVGGVSNSQHIYGRAADIKPLSKNASDIAQLQFICLSANPKGGVGLYDTFCHVDVRGRKALWDNRTKK